jgi:hypothetical protein
MSWQQSNDTHLWAVLNWISKNFKTMQHKVFTHVGPFNFLTGWKDNDKISQI